MEKSSGKLKIKEQSYSAFNGSFTPIREWREDERPREKLIKNGAASLSDAELLAILIGSGSLNFSALDASRTLLKKYENLSRLAACDISEFKQIYGLGDAKAVTLAAAFEISKRIQSEPFNLRKRIRTPEEIALYYIPRFRNMQIEQFIVLLLNSANQVFREVFISQGTLNSSSVHPREVFRLAIVESAAALILVHNHPSGNIEPSREDKEITKRLLAAGKLINIEVLDHIIIAGDEFTSFAQRGLI